ETFAAGSFALVGRAQVGAEVEQIVLNARQHGVDLRVGAGGEPRKADGGIDFIHGAVGGDAQIVFGQAFAVAQRRGAVVAGARVDAVEHDHGGAALNAATARWSSSR